MAEEINIKKNNVASYIEARARTQPHSIALISKSKMLFADNKLHKITFKHLNKLMNGFAKFFIHEKILPGNKIVVLVPISIELYASILGLVKIGAVPVLYEAKELQHQLNLSLDTLEPDAVITLPKISLVLSLNKKYQSIRKKIILKKSGLDDAKKYRNASILRVDPLDPALITFTSGSEGIPKGICRSHRVLARQHEVLQKYLRLNNKDVILTTLPVFALDMIASGATVIVPPLKNNLPWSTVPSKTIEIINNYNVNILMGSPAFLDSFIRWAIKKRIKLYGIKKVYVGGGFLERDLIDRLRESLPKKCEIMTIYGSTEVEPVSIAAPERSKVYNHKYGFNGYFVGKPVDEIKLRIVRFLGKKQGTDLLDVSNGSIGEIIINGSHVNDNYFPKEPAWSNNKVGDPDGNIWHRMGDAGYLDKYKNLWLTGRFKHLPDEATRDYKPFLKLESQLKRLEYVRRVSFLKSSKKISLLLIECKYKNFLEYLMKRKLWEHEVLNICGKNHLNLNVQLCTKLALDRRHNSKIDYQKARRKFIK